MTDADTKIQRILEGRCWLCETLLPEHTIDCEFSPVRDLNSRIERINTDLNVKMDFLKDLVNSNKITVEEFVELLDALQIERGEKGLHE